jgi:hypothetical protein
MKTDYDKPNYNDGNWHEWIFNSRPNEVHPESEIDYFWGAALALTGGFECKKKSDDLIWNNVRFFRVTKVHTEKPKTIWVLDGHICKKDPGIDRATKYREVK